MLDAAHQQEEDARDPSHRVGHDGASGVTKEPLYSILDALNCLDYFGRTAIYEQAFEVVAGVHATFIDAGHILGSASIFLELVEQSNSTSVLFSGDLGNTGRALLRSPAKPPHAENVVMETTYGDRLHKQLGPSIDEFYEAITETFKRGGNVVIPAFALERAQELLYYLSQGVTQGRLTKSTQVYLDSPMAISATEIFQRHPECFEPATAKLFQEGHDPFALPGLHFTRETAESVAINSVHGGAIIMAGSGMCTGGRVLHHIQHNVGREDSSIVFVGYAAIGTLARRIIDGAKQVDILGENIPVRARIYTINGFSAHADQAELLAWQKQTGAKRTFLVHGEEDTMRQFAAHLVDTLVEMPLPHQVFEF
jgi:metallo-beta-lactamase family protein